MTVSIAWTSPLQWGVSAGGAWSDLASDDLTGDLTLQTGASEGGAVFDASSFQTLRTQSGRVLDGPVFTGASLSFFTTRIGASAGPWSLEIGVVPEGDPALFSTSLLPWSRNETSLGSFDLGTVPQIPATLQVLHVFSASELVALRGLAISKGTWSGRLAFSFRTSGTVVRLKNGPSFAFSLLTDQAPFFSGLAGGPYGGPVRVLRDGRYAMPMFSGGLVEDGDQPGLWVRPFDADPDDPEQEYRPRPGEGTVQDKVPNP